jgi:acyl-CoA synthetase (AMP-forming)/AMP-acid ligase II
MKDVIKSGGEWVSSRQIEDLIGQYPGVKEAAVIGIPDEKWGERPIAFVVADTDNADGLHEADIKAHLLAFAFAARRRHPEIRHPRENPRPWPSEVSGRVGACIQLPSHQDYATWDSIAGMTSTVPLL